MEIKNPKIAPIASEALPLPLGSGDGLGVPVDGRLGDGLGLFFPTGSAESTPAAAEAMASAQESPATGMPFGIGQLSRRSAQSRPGTQDGIVVINVDHSRHARFMATRIADSFDMLHAGRGLRSQQRSPRWSPATNGSCAWTRQGWTHASAARRKRSRDASADRTAARTRSIALLACTPTGQRSARTSPRRPARLSRATTT